MTPQQWRDYVVRQQDKLQGAIAVLTDEANKIARGLSNQLFLSAGAIITLSSPALISHQVTQDLPTWARVVAVVGWLLALTSIVFGLIQLSREQRYFVKARDVMVGIDRDIQRGLAVNPQAMQILFDRQNELPKRSTILFETLQVISLSGAAVAFFAMLAYILFTAHK